MANTLSYGGSDGNVVEWGSLCHGLQRVQRSNSNERPGKVDPHVGGNALLSEAGLCQFCAKTIDDGGGLLATVARELRDKCLDCLQCDLMVLYGSMGAENS